MSATLSRSTVKSRRVQLCRKLSSDLELNQSTKSVFGIFVITIVFVFEKIGSNCSRFMNYAPCMVRMCLIFGQHIFYEGLMNTGWGLPTGLGSGRLRAVGLGILPGIVPPTSTCG